jgi:predicted MFS family arabinose efflux permease
MGVSYAVIPVLATPVVAAAAFFVSGLVSVLWNVVTVSARQQIIPPHLFARVNSVYRLLAWGSMPLGAAIGGVLAHRFGLAAPWWVAAIGHAVLVVVAARALHRDRFDAASAATPSNEFRSSRDAGS